MKFKVIISFLLLTSIVIIGANFTFAQEQEKTTIYLFHAEGCPHCAKEEVFLEKLEQENPEIEIKKFEISQNENNRLLLQKIIKELSIKTPGVPVTFIGSHFFFGYQNDEVHGALIKDLIEKHRADKCPDVVVPIIDDFQKECAEQKKSQIVVPEEINIPFFGKIKLGNFSLPILTIIIAALDGFNPCAMWVLLFLISLLLGMKNRKRMWILGGAFIITSALVYFLFLAAWLNLFLFLGFIFWVRLAVGLAALAGGFYYLRKYFKDKADVCQISESKRQQKILEKLKNITLKKQFIMALIGIILLAAAVNLVELICSAGLPAIYTQVLSLSELSTLQYYLYLLLYIFVFMLDDLLIFTLAMVTLKMVGLTKKYSRISALVGGILMAIIGLLLLFKPGWLMFG